MNRVQKGKKGERIAVDYLTKNNYQIIKQNYYAPGGEIDIIAWDEKNQELVFIEVKSRASDKYGYAEEAVDDYKLGKIVKAVGHYLNKVAYAGSYRFDCLSIEFDYAIKKARVRHFKNICF